MTDFELTTKGYTKHVMADCAAYSLELAVKEDVDFDSSFKAWDLNEGEFITVHGWNWTFEEE